MTQPDLRAADTDRARVAGELGRSQAAGRLTVAEYDERLTRAYAARTLGELAGLTADLPADRPAPAPGPAAVAGCGAGQLTNAWRGWLTVALIVLAVWAMSSLGTRDLQPFWPGWVIGPWGAALLARTLTGGHGGRLRHRARTAG
ncbi:DUF1707 domain-containing protein [Modestobacter sp. I12A-02628]|uniref:DUF1707 domain-containing protein n=1 Tax=Goekera deserti TaxID=2497753 RepID=A0A7K3WIB4_9ACTN|nr:DUF1707 domain-containing protein [Goekera deserti]MPR00102.1 DUF1707 domain-containing protein [Goekera deserti]NDI49881.1 DUF1707 domain-containing protein [Goekera deserti]NEL55243.1 DUF1707 domain-containing protein [Goekera deserti]